MLHVYAMLLGNVDLERFSGINYGFFYQIMFIIFVYLQTILMMNLIIAMMGESFEKVLQTAQRELTMDRAETLVRVELTMGVAAMRKKGYIPRYLQVIIILSTMRICMHTLRPCLNIMTIYHQISLGRRSGMQSSVALPYS